MKYKFKRTPYKHQVKALKKLLSTKYGGALLMSPRTGKTKVLVDYASILYQGGKIDKVLVVCPLSAMGVWEDEIELNCPFPYTVVVWDRDGRKQIDLPENEGFKWVLINPDAFSFAPKTPSGRPSKKSGRFKIRQQLFDWGPHLMIVDESHRIKNPSAKKSTMIHSFNDKVPYRCIATGTLVTKKTRLYDVYSQWKFLNPDTFKGHTAETFKMRYARWTNRHGYPMWIKNRNEKELRSIIHKESYSITREECYDLPKARHQVISVDMVESRPAYDDMAAEMLHRLRSGEITAAQIKLTQGLRLAQITSGLAKTEPTEKHPKGRIVIVGREKLEILRDQLLDLVEADEKVVIGARFRADLKRIEHLCKILKIPSYLVMGGTTRKRREEAIRGFRSINKPAVFIGQPRAVAEGIDLSSAGVMIWYSLTNSYVDWKQFCDRIALAKGGALYMYLLGKSTYDFAMYQDLLEDKDVQEMIHMAPEKTLGIDNLET